MILIIKNILGILTDPKNTRMFLFGSIVVLLFLLVRQCNETQSVRGEVTRIQNNLTAANDTIINYVNEQGEAVGEIKGLILTLDELKDTQTDYLLWLLDAMENDTKKHSPTQIAIMKYIKHCV